MTILRDLSYEREEAGESRAKTIPGKWDANTYSSTTAVHNDFLRETPSVTDAYFMIYSRCSYCRV